MEMFEFLLSNIEAEKLLICRMKTPQMYLYEQLKIKMWCE